MRFMIGFAIASTLLLAPTAYAKDPLVTFEDGDSIVFMGNTFAERLRHHNHFEAMLTSRLYELNLTFRNLAWSADEITLRPRPLDFGDIHTHLANQKADVIFLCYGANESFNGEAGLPQFRKDLGEFLRSILARRYNGETSPRLVLVSPIPQEPIEAMPNVLGRNLQIASYAAAMKQVAAMYEVPYLDLFSSINSVRSSGLIEPLTFNGVHLSDYGNWVVAHLMMQELGYYDWQQLIVIDAATEKIEAVGAMVSNFKIEKSSLSFTGDWIAAPHPSSPNGLEPPPDLKLHHPTLRIKNLDSGIYELTSEGHVIATAKHTDWAQGVQIHVDVPNPKTVAIDELVEEKNQLFFDRYRAINGYYIYGGRKEPFGVVSFPPEMSRFDELVSGLDGQIHETVQAPISTSYELKPTGE